VWLSVRADNTTAKASTMLVLIADKPEPKPLRKLESQKTIKKVKRDAFQHETI
jgi:hypothetical protein